MAGDKMTSFLFYQQRLRLGAQPGSLGAAVPESTAAREMQRARHHTRDRIETLFLFISRAGQRIQ
jgi:hypothetical protein